jgi:anti-sigma factor RsiW
MNCQHCQEILSEYIDGELNAKESFEVESHLKLCVECAEIHEDFAQFLGICEKEDFAEVEPPNSQAMWCRISNIIETEVKPEIIKEAEIKEQNRGWFSKIWHKNWSLSFAQVGLAALAVTIISSLLTIVAIKNYSRPTDNFDNQASAAPSLFERVLGKIGVVETVQESREKRIKQQQSTIDYWNSRVQQRRMQWKAHLRDAFDRNLAEIDQVVTEYTRILEENPNDEVSGEMLDTALNEKVELLREFSEL